MAVHEKFVVLAQRLIKKHGREITLVQFEGPSTTSTTPWQGAVDPRGDVSSNLTVYAVFVPPSGVASLGLEIETQDLFKNSERVLIFSAGDQVDVSGYSEVEDGSSRWKINILRVLRPGTVSVLAYAGVSR